MIGMIWWNEEKRVAFAYVMNSADFGTVGDKRSHRLIREFVKCLSNLPPTGVSSQVLEWSSVAKGHVPVKDNILASLESNVEDFIAEQTGLGVSSEVERVKEL